MYRYILEQLTHARLLSARDMRVHPDPPLINTSGFYRVYDKTAKLEDHRKVAAHAHFVRGVAERIRNHRLQLKTKHEKTEGKGSTGKGGGCPPPPEDFLQFPVIANDKHWALLLLPAPRTTTATHGGVLVLNTINQARELPLPEIQRTMFDLYGSLLNQALTLSHKTNIATKETRRDVEEETKEQEETGVSPMYLFVSKDIKYAHACAHTHPHIHTHTSVRALRHTYMHERIKHAHKRAHTHPHIHVYIHNTQARNKTHTRTHPYIRTHAYILVGTPRACSMETWGACSPPALIPY